MTEPSLKELCQKLDAATCREVADSIRQKAERNALSLYRAGKLVERGEVEALERFDEALKTDPEYYKNVFPDGPPKRQMSVGKHQAFNYIVMRAAIAKAERLDSHLADMLMWSVWWQCLDSQRAEMLSKQVFEAKAENAKLREECEALRRERESYE